MGISGALPRVMQKRVQVLKRLPSAARGRDANGLAADLIYSG